MLAPALLTAPAASQATQAAPAGAAAQANLPPELRDAIGSWLWAENPYGDLPRTTGGLLAALRGGAALPPAPVAGGWEAYFAAMGTQPTPEEAAAIRDFRARNPYLSLEIEALAAKVAHGRALRDQAFSALTDAQWLLLPEALDGLATGQGLTPDQQAAVAAVDMTRLLDAAALLSDAAEGAPERIRKATALDESLAAGIPLGLRDPATLDDPAAILRAAAGDAAPVVTDLSLHEVLRGLGVLAGAPAATTSRARALPAEMHEPLAAVLVAYSAELAANRPGTGRAFLATLADNLPALTRAAYNVSLTSSGALALLDGHKRPLEHVTPSGLNQPTLVLADLFGAPAATVATPASLQDGLTRLHDALGIPVTPGALAEAQRAEAAFGRDLAGAIGTLLSAQADYERVVRSQPFADAVDLREATDPILQSSGPLTPGDIRLLQESVSAERNLRDDLGAAAAALVDAILSLNNVRVPAMTASTADHYDLGPVLILDDKSSTVDRARFPAPRVAVIDLGGDDTYSIPLAGVSALGALSTSPGPNDARTAIAVDLGGHDKYEAVEDVSLGAVAGDPTSPAFAFLLDTHGHDSYAAKKHAFGYARDGFAFHVDVRGDDTYQADHSGLANAYATLRSLAAGVFVDVIGNDKYVVPYGFAHLEEGSATTTVAFFLDIIGADRYATACPLRHLAVECFGWPRPENSSTTAGGAAVFIDLQGNNTYPRIVDPITTGEWAYHDEFSEEADLPFYGDAVEPGGSIVEHWLPFLANAVDRTSVPQANAGRYAYVSDTRSELAVADQVIVDTFLAYNAATERFLPGFTPFLPPLYTFIRDDDGDIIPSGAEGMIGHNANDGSDPGTSIDDTDGDGFVDIVERLLSTNPYDRDQAPASVPTFPSDVPAPGLPLQSAANFIVNLPGLLAIGGPGPTRYDLYYSITLDIGVGTDENDHYLNATASNGVALDFGGKDNYAPRPLATTGQVPPSFASINDGEVGRVNAPNQRNVELALLVDLDGDDQYFARESSLGSARQQFDESILIMPNDNPSLREGGMALFLDVGGNDKYRAPNGRSQGYAEGDNVAYFIDLGGNDEHFVPQQAILDAAPDYHFVSVAWQRSTTIGRGALFLDAAGTDTYDAGSNPLTLEALDASRGNVRGHENATINANGNRAPGLDGHALPIAAFLDLGGDDKHFYVDHATLQKRDAGRDDRFLVHPLDGGNASRVGIYLDADVGDSDKDGKDAGDAVGSGSESGESLDDATTHLHLPRVGIVVGKKVPNLYAAHLEYGLQVDVGVSSDNSNAADTYLNRAGASSVRFPVSLLVDAGGNDVYRYEGSNNLSAFFTPRVTVHPLYGTTQSAAGWNGPYQSNRLDVHYGAAQGAGIFGVGILRDADGYNEFTYKANLPAACPTCDANLVGASQGAGVLGVGILAVTGDKASRSQFSVQLDAVSEVGNLSAHTTSQGAGLQGIGLLVTEGALGNDLYVLEAATRTTGGSHNSTSGQGYGLEGTGILLDAGGNNTFLARNLAQGAADAIARGMNSTFLISAGPVGMPGGVYRPSTSVGQLLLPGAGDDTLNATAMAQAFATGPTASAFLFDGDGNDNRTLRATDFQSVLLGQGAAYRGGTAILLDNRGNDRYVTDGFGAQGYGSEGTGILVDLAGADVYVASNLAQGVVSSDFWVMNGLSPTSQTRRFTYPAFAIFLDRRGNDVYEILPGAVAQGVALWGRIVGPVGESSVHHALALFMETGGTDLYRGVPRGQVATSSTHHEGGKTTTVTVRPETGNNWQWTGHDGVTNATRSYQAHGLDADTASSAVRLLAEKAGVTLMQVDPPCAEAGRTCSDVLHLTASLGKGGSKIPSARAVDRVEFYDNDRYLGPGQINSSTSSDHYYFQMNTTAQEDGRIPIHPDGHHTVTALIFPRLGADADGRRAAADAEPINVTANLRIDNPPVPHAPKIERTLSTSQGNVSLQLRVERDLECLPGCSLKLDHVKAGPNEWQNPPTIAAIPSSSDPGCPVNGDGCAPLLAVRSGNNAAYVSWSQPNLAGIRAYRVDREDGSGAATPVAYIDARSPMRLLGGENASRYSYVDATPGAATTNYTVNAIYTGSSGSTYHTTARAPFVPSTTPGPATGLRAYGVEGRVVLDWNGADGATHYRINRSYPGGPVVTLPTTPEATFYEDFAVTTGVEYTYTIQPLAGAAGGNLTSLNVTARPAAGDRVTLGFAADVFAPFIHKILDNASLGGGQIHNLTWQPPTGADAIPDGRYWLNATFRDSAGRMKYDGVPVHLDGTPPTTTVDLPPNAGGPHLEGGSLRIPFTATDGSGTGVKQTAIYVRTVGEPWGAPFIAPAGAKDVVYHGVRDGTTIQVLALSEDNVSNVEGVSFARNWRATLAEGFSDLLNAGRFSTHHVDLSPPVGQIARQTHHVRPNDTIEIKVVVTDRGTGVRSVHADIRGEIVDLFSTTVPDEYRGTWKAHGTDGSIQLMIQADDHAGNVHRFSAGVIAIDSFAPTLDAAIAFAGGRTVGRSGETATLRVASHDANGQDGTLNVTADLTNVSSAGAVVLRYDPEARVYVTSFPVNKLVGSSANVSIRSADRAGNVGQLVMALHVNGTATTVGDPILTVGSDWVLVNWTTADAVRGRVDYGLSPQMGQSSPLDAVGRDHLHLITGLRPDTDYYAFAVGVTESGIETRSDILQFRTGPALNVTYVSNKGFPHSNGDTTLGVLVRRYDGATPNAVLEAYLHAPRGAPRLVGTATGAGVASILPLDLTGIRDGTYNLVVTARQQDDRGESQGLPFVVDRAAPLLAPPSVKALVAGATLAIQVEERGSGIDLDNVVWTFNGRRCSAQLAYAGDLISCKVPSLGSDATVRMVLHIPDRAGNAVDLQLELDVDGAAPVVTRHSLTGVDGSPHVQPGKRARVSVDVTDLSATRVVADLLAFGGALETPLHRVPGTNRYETTFDVPASMTEGAIAVRVRAIDASGKETRIDVESRVDGKAPALLRSSFANQGPGEVLVAIQSDENVRATVKAAGPLGEIHAISPSQDVTHVLYLRGLRPGAPLRATITITDAAGHETTTLLEGTPIVDKVAPARVPILRAEDRGDGRVLLRWDAATDDGGIAGYRILRSVAGAAIETVATIQALTYADAVPTGVPIVYTVAAVDHAGNAGEVARAEITSLVVPRLANGTVDPPLGGPGLFTFSVDLTDPSGGAPALVVRVDGVDHPMTPDKADCRNGCRYAATLLVGAETLATGPHQYSFHVISGGYRVSFPEVDALTGPTVLQGEAPPLVGVLAAANRVPGSGLLLGGLAIAGAALAIWLRRRKA